MTRSIDPSIFKKGEILDLCVEAIGSKEIHAACFYGPRIYGQENDEADINTLIIMPNYAPKIISFARRLSSVNVSILAVDREAFENDIENGKYGESVAEIVALPYRVWINQTYFAEIEVKLKKRFVLGLMKNIVLQYPELSAELLIKPEYFMYEAIRRRAKLYPPLAYIFSNIFTKKVRKRNTSSMMKGYLRALRELEAEGQVVFSNSHIQISNDFIEATKRKRTRFSTILVSIRKAILPYIRGISLKMITTFLQDRKFLEGSQNHGTERDIIRQLEETEKYLLMPTPLGPVPLSDETSIEDFVRKTVPGGEALKISIKGLGGVLNNVFLIRLQKNHETRKIVAKKFEDWLGFKWFPLALWTLGTQSFAVLSTTRLEREYSTNQFLSKQGFCVPRILYVSLKERLIFEEFVEGEKISEIVREMVTASSEEDIAGKAGIIKLVGREIAKVHMLGIALGDCKPENIFIVNDRKICFLDLEQAVKNGNQPWDIAEFLYYSGHYILPTYSDEAAKAITSSFIEGYLEAGGEKENVRKAASAKYTKVFSIFTLPHIILLMSNICKEMGNSKDG